MAELVLAFQLGLANMTNPCVLPLYPGFLAYLAGNQGVLENKRTSRWLGLTAMAGVLTSMLILGLLLALLQVAIGQALALLLPVIYGIVIVMGVLLVLRINPFARLPALQSPRLKNPVLSSYLYGLLYGPMTLPCSGPTVVGVFAFSLDAASTINGVLFAVAFGLGFGLPLVILPLLAEPVRKSLLRWMTNNYARLSQVAGLLLIAIGVFGFINEWELIRDNVTALFGG